MSATQLERADQAARPGGGGITRPLRVVHLLHTVAYGGVETIVIDWATSLDPARVAVMVVCFADPGQTELAFQEAAARAGVAVQTIPWGRHKPVLRATRALTAILRTFEADVIHTHNVYAEMVGWMAARRTGIKVMTTLYVWSDFGWKRNVQQWFAARLLRRFDLVTSQCTATLNDTVARGVPRSLQKVLVSGIRPVTDQRDDTSRRAIRAEHGSGDDDVVLVNVARFYPEKAQARLLECFAEINRLRPRAKLWLLGVGPLEEALRRQVAELGLDDAVAFLGFVVDASQTMMAADIQVHPSHAEGIPLAVCAGMASGMPIIATAVGGLPEIIRHDETGLLIAEWDRAAFIAATLRLIDDARLRRSLGEAARRASETELSLPSAAARLAAMYDGLVS